MPENIDITFQNNGPLENAAFQIIIVSINFSNYIMQATKNLAWVISPLSSDYSDGIRLVDHGSFLL